MSSEKEQVALTSIFASGGLMLAKLAIGLLTGSLAILSEAAHSGVDLAATIMTWWAVKISGKPADDNHPYGHGKVESVAALIETGLLAAIAVVVAKEAILRLMGDAHEVQATPLAFAIIGGSVVVDFFRVRALKRVAAATKSHALEADALHFASDMWSSIAVFAGLIGVAMGEARADAIASLAVVVFVVLAGWRLGKSTIDTLTDTAPAGAADQVRDAIDAVPGIVGIERIRVRPAGATLFVDALVTVSRSLPLERTLELKLAAAKAVRDKLPEAEVDIGTHPLALDDETIMERVHIIARNRALAVHHVTVQEIGERIAVSLDLEVDGQMPLGKAHDIATDLEHAIREELGDGVEVETHIEPLQVQGIDGQDAPELVQDISGALRMYAEAAGPIQDIHNVRVRRTPSGLFVMFHCRTHPGMVVEDVHRAVDELERSLRRARPDVARAIGHAEPIKAR